VVFIYKEKEGNRFEHNRLISEKDALNLKLSKL